MAATSAWKSGGAGDGDNSDGDWLLAPRWSYGARWRRIEASAPSRERPRWSWWRRELGELSWVAGPRLRRTGKGAAQVMSGGEAEVLRLWCGEEG
ncbi:hypothetical protein M0R45_003651 [Rubus argutus]|uniref:Uncharacterized protein n=1 Tax=Rubus argutus TaxID=59490 RepID=A0AAW1YID1_RUBAR